MAVALDGSDVVVDIPDESEPGAIPIFLIAHGRTTACDGFASCSSDILLHVAVTASGLP